MTIVHKGAVVILRNDLGVILPAAVDACGKRRRFSVFLRIDPDNGIPIYDQIVRQVKYAVAEGTLTPGQLVPSVRELAKQITVNPNTIQRAYQQLQDHEVLESLRGRGLAVCKGAVKQCVLERQELLRNRMEQVITEGLRSGLDIDQLRVLFEKSVKQVSKLED